MVSVILNRWVGETMQRDETKAQQILAKMETKTKNVITPNENEKH